jgi:putative hydrolase of the HAD superfamily
VGWPKVHNTVIQAVIFDMDGLIIDTEWPDYQSWQELYAEHGHDLPMTEWIPFVGLWGPPLSLAQRLCELIGDGVDQEALHQRQRVRCRELVRQSMTPMRGFVELMEWLTVHDLRRGLASTSSRDWVDRVVDGLAVRHHFHALVAGDEVAVRKPAPDVYLRAAERLSVPPQACLALEDSAPGVASARAAGMRCIAVPNRITSYQDLSAAHRQVAHLGEITPDLLRSL